jgi:integrase
MASIKARKRTDGGTSYLVRWREGGTRVGKEQSETFASGADKENLIAAERFRKRVELADQHWPKNWVAGVGEVEPDRVRGDQKLVDVGLEYVAQIVDCSPGQRRRYRGQLRILENVELVRHDGALIRPFAGYIADVTEDDIKLWLIQFDRALKTKSNYHGFLHGVFTYAIEKHLTAVHPLARTGVSRSKIKASQGDLRFLREAEFGIMLRLAHEDIRDLLLVEAGTGLRFGEITALWVEDVDFEQSTVRVNKAWKREGDDGEQDVPTWLKKRLGVKHVMRGHYLGNPKTPKSKRTITFSPLVGEALQRAVDGKQPDDLIFTSPTGKPHHTDFYEDRWVPLLGKLDKVGIRGLRFHDLRHTHVAWLIAGNVSLPHIQQRVGHDSIVTTIDTYGHLLPQGNEIINQVIECALRGQRIRPTGVVLHEEAS